VAGIHLHGFVAFPAGDPGELTATEQQRLGRLRRWQAERGGYSAIQGSRPQTLAYAMADSPAGLLGWYLEWFDDYGEHVGAIGNDQILTNVATYWLTGTAGSAARLYKEAAANWAAQPGYCEVSTALAIFPATQPSASSPRPSTMWPAGRNSSAAAISPRCSPRTSWSATCGNSSPAWADRGMSSLPMLLLSDAW